MTEDSDIDVDDFGVVVVSFTVVAAAPIEGLAPYLHESQIRDDEFFYDLGMESFEASGAQARADKLDATINGFIDFTDPIPREALHDPETFVRLYMTFGRGAQTIPAKTLKRLADVDATIWNDA